MANPNMSNDGSKNQTIQSEQAKAEVGGGSSGGDRQREQGMDKNRSPIGGGERSQTGEPGRARNELDESKGQAGQKSESDKSRSETAGSR